MFSNENCTPLRPSSRGEGPSDLARKGKMIDPREWGAVNLQPEEMDIDAQRKLFELYAARSRNTLAPDPNPLFLSSNHHTVRVVLFGLCVVLI